MKRRKKQQQQQQKKRWLLVQLEEGALAGDGCVTASSTA
jgi:hypothetical protein